MVEDLLVESLLKTSDSLIIFRRRSGSIMQVAGAVDLVVYDAANPRSVIYQLDRLFHHLADLPTQSPSQRLGDEQQLVLEATTMLRLTDAARLAAVDPDADRRPELDSVLGRVDDLLAELLDSLRHTFFAHERLSVLDGRQPDSLGRSPMMYRIVHRTNYRYNAPVSRCRNEAHLRPRDTDRQHCLASDLVVEPTPTSWSERSDFFGNPVRLLRRRRTLRRADGDLDQLGVGVGRRAPAAHRAGMGAGPRLPGHDLSAEMLAAREFCFESPLVPISVERPHLRRALLSGRDGRWSTPSPSSPSGSSHDFVYDPGFTTVTTPLEEVLQLPAGRLPGLRPPGHRVLPIDGPGRPLRERLPGDRGTGRRGAADRRRRLPRLALGVRPRVGMARRRSRPTTRSSGRPT